METTVEIMHSVNPDGKGYQRVYAVLDSLLWDRPGLATYYPYGRRANNILILRMSGYADSGLR